MKTLLNPDKKVHKKNRWQIVSITMSVIAIELRDCDAGNGMMDGIITDLDLKLEKQMKEHLVNTIKTVYPIYYDFPTIDDITFKKIGFRCYVAISDKLFKRIQNMDKYLKNE